jgi:two-component system alkaline phosphatase synthesis response regulator PhoP
VKKHILVVDDEEDILELVEYNLRKAGFEVSTLASGSPVIAVTREKLPDLIVLDLMLPGLDGHELCSLLRNDPKTRAIPIVMLTAKSQETDVVVGLDLGADDYITKPFSPKVLVARVQAVLRRIGDLLIHPGRHEVTIGGKSIDLTFTEFRVLHCLARRPGWVYSRAQIVDAVRGEGYAVTDRAVDVQIVGLRKKLGEYGKLIETVRGVGYRFKD